MEIEDLLSPYRGFVPSAESLADASTGVGRRRTQPPRLPSPESWEMSEFVRELTA